MPRSTVTVRSSTCAAMLGFATLALRGCQTWHEEQKRGYRKASIPGICAARQFWSDPRVQSAMVIAVRSLLSTRVALR